MFQAQPDTFGPKIALVADDNALMRMLLAHMLMRRGFAVTEVGSGEEALAALQGGVFDLVMLDIRMYALSGIEVCHRIREELGLLNVPVIACTAYRGQDDLSHMQMAGFSDILYKPLGDEELDQSLGRVFAEA